MTVSPTLDKRFREAAAAAGLLDVAYDLAETPIGTLLVATTERGLCRISYDPQPEREAESLAHMFGVRVLRAAKPIDPVRRQLEEYSKPSARSSSCRSTSATRLRSVALCSIASRASPTDR